MKRCLANASRPIISGLILALALTLSCLGLEAAPDQDKGNFTDMDVTKALETELWIQDGVNLYWIDIETTDGVVTLSGTVDNLLAKERAVKIAASTKGVKSVVDRIQVSPKQRPDSAIVKDIQKALLDDPATERFEVAVAVQGGKAQLSGVVDSWAEKNLVETVAKGVRGVEGVENNLTVAYKATRLDSEIQSDIQQRLHWDIRVDDGLVDVAVDRGAVSLSGTVGSLLEKKRTIADAWVAGTKSVDASGLEVKMWARDERLRKGKYVVKDDQAVKEAIVSAFRHDPRVWSLNPEVEVDNGVATLRGQVDNLKAREAALRDARNTVGVWRVVNRLKVRPAEIPSDDDLIDRVGLALERSPFVDREEVHVQASHGIVTLSGTLQTEFEKERAYHAASNVKGVVDVRDRMLIQYALGRNSDWEIEEDIRDQLFWSPFVDSDEVTVDVQDGVARLTGTVDTLSERRAAETNALEGGAVAVDNDLKLKFGPVRYHP